MAWIPPWVGRTLVAAVSLFLVAVVGGNAYGAWYLARRGAMQGEHPGEPDDPALERDLAAMAPEDVRIGPEGLKAWYSPGSVDRPGWVLVPGGGSNRTAEASRARALHEQGHSVVALELSYVSGAPFGGGSREGREIASALEWLAQRTGGRRPLLYGCSLGAFCVLNAVAAGAPAAAVVADSGFVSILRMGAERGYPQALLWPLPRLFPLFSGGAELRDLGRSVASDGLPIPTLIIQGTADRAVDPGQGPDLARLTRGELWAPDGVDHCEAFSARRGEFLERLGRLAALAGNR